MIDKINAALMSAETAPDGVCFHRNAVLSSTGIFTFTAGGPDDNVQDTVYCLDCGCELPDGEPEPPDCLFFDQISDEPECRACGMGDEKWWELMFLEPEW